MAEGGAGSRASAGRLAVLSRHVCTANGVSGVSGKTAFNKGALRRFLSDPKWAGKPVWMLNVLKFKQLPGAAAKYAEYTKAMAHGGLPAGAVMRLSGHARTFVGEREYDYVAIVEYPSPESFAEMITSGAQGKRNHHRLAGLEEQLLIPLRVGWRVPPGELRKTTTPESPITRFTAATVAAPPSGLIGAAATGSRPGKTSSTAAQAAALCNDPRFATDAPVWNLVLNRYKPGGRELHQKYGRELRPGEVIARMGAWVSVSSECGPALIGEQWDQAGIVVFPNRDSFLTVGTAPEYIEAAQYRHTALDATFIISTLPERINA